MRAFAFRVFCFCTLVSFQLSDVNLRPVYAQEAADKTKSTATTTPDKAAQVLDGKTGEKRMQLRGTSTSGSRNLSKQQKLLQLQRSEMDQAQRDLQFAEERLSKKISEFKKLKEELTSIRDEIKAMKEKEKAEKKIRKELELGRGMARGKKLDHLKRICEKMPPESAARYLEALDLDVASAILARMSVRKAAAILAVMDKKTAVSLSKRYMNHDMAPAPEPKRKSRR
ncbi:MAG: hypothetical protein CMH54_00380 [Myxococcales bacterium]|nr:hypothetical protein [Myxococcales bacterium]